MRVVIKIEGCQGTKKHTAKKRERGRALHTLKDNTESKEKGQERRGLERCGKERRRRRRRKVARKFFS